MLVKDGSMTCHLTLMTYPLTLFCFISDTYCLYEKKFSEIAHVVQVSIVLLFSSPPIPSGITFLCGEGAFVVYQHFLQQSASCFACFLYGIVVVVVVAIEIVGV